MGNIILGLVSGIVAGGLTTFAAIKTGKLQRSGSVVTSEAGDLWHKTTELAADLRAQIVLANARIAVLEDRNERLDRERQEIRNEHTELRITHAQCEARLAILEAQVNRVIPSVVTTVTTTDNVPSGGAV